MTSYVVVVPHDVVQDILLCLPVKSVQRLRCLSKFWDSLISAQSFAKLLLRRASESPKERSQKIFMFSPPHPFLVLDHKIGSSLADEAAISKLDFPSKTSVGSMVVGSCHGLICLTLGYGDDMDFCLWNPITENYKNLSHPSFLPDKKSLQNNTVIVCSYERAFGFGYDSFSDDYKVFLGLRPSRLKTGAKEDKFTIFSTKENTWRIIQLPPNYTLPVFENNSGPRCGPRRGSFVNGALTWLVQHNDQGKAYSLIAFDLKTERFFELPMPDENDEDARYVYPCAGLSTGLGIFEGKLCLSTTKYERSLKSFLVEFWIMNEYGVRQSWRKLLIAPLQSNSFIHIPICLSKDNQIIIVANSGNKLIRIDAQGRKLEARMVCKGHELVYGASLFCFCEAITYLESLVWPFKDTCVEKKEEQMF